MKHNTSRSGARPSRAQALALLGGALALGTPATAFAQTADPIRMGTIPLEPYLGPFYARDLGAFTKAGLNVDIQVFPNAGVTLQAVVGNALDLGCANLIQVASGFIRGVDLAIVAAGGVYASTASTIGVYVAKDSPIKTVKDLEGQTISINNLRGTESIAISEWLKRGGANPDKVKFFELPFSQVAAALARGTVAAGLGPQVPANSPTPVRRLGDPYGAIAPQFYTAVWAARREYLNKNAARMRTLVKILNDTSRWANTHHDETATIMSGITKIDAADIHAMIRIPYATTLETKYAQPLLDQAFAYKLIDKPVNAADIFWS